ncbi:MAG: hypothetical protein E6Q97_38270 [Desulfurellales bacterium]|nr:MAG: hypothetical protein E6Q97_38270 [Desulfurellales bacterium]
MFPLSQLPEHIQEKHNQYVGTSYVTYVKYVKIANFFRFAISDFGEMDSMLKQGWMVINATK